MVSEAVINLSENIFKQLSGSESVNYRLSLPYQGKIAKEEKVQNGIVCQNVLTRRYAEIGTKQEKPTGNMYSLAFETADLNTKQPHPRITTKIDLYNAEDTPFVEERIKRAIAAQKAMRKIVDEDVSEGLGYLTDADNLPFDYMRVDNLGNNGFYLFINHREGKSRSNLPISLTKRLGDDTYEKSKLEARIGLKKDFAEVIPALDVQLEKFQGLKF